MNSLLVGKITELPTRVTLAGRQVQLLKLLRQLPGRREVWQANTDEGMLLLKCFSGDSAGARDYQRELRGFEGWQQRAIPSPQLLFHQGSSPAILAAQWLDGESALTVYHKAHRLVGKRALCLELLVFVAQQLAAGCEQADIHLGNFQRSADDWAVLDAAACKFYDGAVPPAVVQTNLAGLLAQFRIDIARAVMASKPKLAVAVDWPALEQEHLELTRRRHARAAAKSLRNCTEFAEIKNTELSGMARRRDWALVESMAHRGLDEIIDGGKALKLGGSATVAQVRFDGRDLVIKRYNTKSAGHRIKKLLTRSRAKKSWLNAVWLRSAEIGTPLPIAFLEQRGLSREGLAYFIAEPAHGPDLLAVNQTVLLRSRVADLLAGLVVNMYLLGFNHGDLKGTNLIIEHDELIVIDLDAMQRDLPERRARQLIAKDIERLCRNWDDGEFKQALLQALKQALQELAA